MLGIFKKKLEDNGPDLSIIEELTTMNKLPFPTERLKSLEGIDSLIKNKPRKAIPILNHKIQENPNDPFLYSLLYMAKVNFGEEKEAKEIIIEAMKKFPDYLFSKLQYAAILLNEDRAEEIPALFNYSFNVKNLGPNVTALDVMIFWKIICEYYFEVEKEEKAYNYYYVLKKLGMEDDYLDALFADYEEEEDSNEEHFIKKSISDESFYTITENSKSPVYAGTEDALEEMYHMAQNEPKKALPKLKELTKEYPQEPSFLNYLYVCNQLLNNKKECDRIIKETIKKFPDYLFGKISYANQLIDENREDEVLAIFNNETELQKICPDRKEFHKSEAVAFYVLMGRYYTVKYHPEIAIQYFELVHKLKPENKPVFQTLTKLKSFMKLVPKEMKRKIQNIAGSLVKI